MRWVGEKENLCPGGRILPAVQACKISAAWRSLPANILPVPQPEEKGSITGCHILVNRRTD